MDEEIRNRAKEALAWLKEQRVILSQKDAAVKMGYNPCVMSTILNRHDKLSNRFVERLPSMKVLHHLQKSLRDRKSTRLNSSHPK